MSRSEQSEQEVITFVPERSLRRRRVVSRVLFWLIAGPICVYCFYAFGVGQYQNYRVAQIEPKPAAVVQTNDDCQRERQRAFRIGRAVGRLEKAWESAK